MRPTCDSSNWIWAGLATILVLVGRVALFAEDWKCPYCGKTFQFDPRDSGYRSQWISLHLGACGGGSVTRIRPKTGPTKEELERKDLKEASDDANDRGAEFYRKGEWGQAITCFKEALDYHPENDDAQYNLRKAQEKAEAARKALATLEAARKQQEATMREARETARRLLEQRRARMSQMQADLDRVTVPPPLPKEKFSLSWKTLALNPEANEVMIKVADGVVFVGELSGQLCGRALPVCKIILVAGKVFIAGEDGAYVQLVRQEKIYEEALAYLRNRDTAKKFAGIVRDLRQGRAPASSNTGMLRAARAILDPALGNSGSRMAWDAMLSPEAKAAMARKALIEAGLEAISQGTEGVLSDLTRQKQVYDALRLNRDEARHMLKEATEPLERIKLQQLISHSDGLLAQTYRLENDSIKVFVEVEAESINAVFDQPKTLQEK